ncbi:MAG TPA: 23S rRNA (guanosine(2251)-2'-O)-methyltransferase RlmB [Elusimicrobia bacterium]|nr:23S rRNA (guanosine(2251)-2'-O)-methyltransferase RlmB [Elusimicrobiota bacterium]
MKQPSRWLFGTHVVEETLNSGQMEPREVWIQRDRGRNSAELAKTAKGKGIHVRWVTRRELDKLASGESHQGLAVRVDAPGSDDFEEFLAALPEPVRAQTVLVALDQVQDPQNVGAIARSALCLGAGALLVPDRRSAGASQGALSASAGALSKIPVFQVGNLAQTLTSLKEAGFWIYGADMEGTTSWDVRFNRPMVLVIGSEGAGMRPLVRSRCDEVASIPQAPGGVQSLNASAAAAILLYEASRQAHA